MNILFHKHIPTPILLIQCQKSNYFLRIFPHWSSSFHAIFHHSRTAPAHAVFYFWPHHHRWWRRHSSRYIFRLKTSCRRRDLRTACESPKWPTYPECRKFICSSAKLFSYSVAVLFLGEMSPNVTTGAFVLEVWQFRVLSKHFQKSIFTSRLHTWARGEKAFWEWMYWTVKKLANNNA